MTLIERMARALAMAAWDRFNGRDSGFAQMKYPNGVGQYCAEQWSLYESDARKVLLAIYEPTDHMVDGAGGEYDQPRLIWKDMVDAALKE